MTSAMAAAAAASWTTRIRRRWRRALRSTVRSATSGSGVSASADARNPSRSRRSMDIVGHLLGEQRAESLAGAMQMDPASRYRAAGDLGDLFHRPILEVEERDHSSLLGRETPDGGTQTRIHGCDGRRFHPILDDRFASQDGTASLALGVGGREPDRDPPYPRARSLVAPHFVPVP